LTQADCLKENSFACHLQLILADPGPTNSDSEAPRSEIHGTHWRRQDIPDAVEDAAKKFAPKAVDI